MLRNSRDFVKQGACVGADLDLFFPEYATKKQEAEAKALCGSCIVRETCLEYALAGEDRNGIWGGLTSEERDVLLADRPLRSICVECTFPFEYPRSEADGGRRYCGERCAAAGKKRRRNRNYLTSIPALCPICGASGRSGVSNGTCSPLCHFVFTRTEARKIRGDV